MKIDCVRFGLIEVEKFIVKRKSGIELFSPKRFSAYSIVKVLSECDIKDKFVLIPTHSVSELACPSKNHYVVFQKEIVAIVEPSDEEVFVPEVKLTVEDEDAKWR